MSIKTFSVTLTDLGTYTLDVAAFDEQQACDIARHVCTSNVSMRRRGFP